MRQRGGRGDLRGSRGMRGLGGPEFWDSGRTSEEIMTLMTERYQLTDEQKTKLAPMVDQLTVQRNAFLEENRSEIERLRTAQQQMMERVRNGDRPTPQEWQAATDGWRALREKSPATPDKIVAAVEEALPPEQIAAAEARRREQFEAMREQWRQARAAREAAQGNGTQPQPGMRFEVDPNTGAVTQVPVGDGNTAGGQPTGDGAVTTSDGAVPVAPAGRGNRGPQRPASPDPDMGGGTSPVTITVVPEGDASPVTVQVEPIPVTEQAPAQPPAEPQMADARPRNRGADGRDGRAVGRGRDRQTIERDPAAEAAAERASDAWTQFVEQYIKDQKLDSAPATSCRAILSEMLERREQFRAARAEQYAKVAEADRKAGRKPAEATPQQEQAEQAGKPTDAPAEGAPAEGATNEDAGTDAPAEVDPVAKIRAELKAGEDRLFNELRKRIERIK